jgi:hypothetical protein
MCPNVKANHIPQRATSLPEDLFLSRYIVGVYANENGGAQYPEKLGH